LPIVSIDEGIQIERSEHSANADSPRVETLLSDANVTDKTEMQPWKHPAEIERILVAIVTFGSFPKYRTRILPSNEP
jgi:hypothetical protein